MEKKLIIDVSTHQKEIDWDLVKAQGIGGAILRIGYTGWGSLKSYIDAYFEQNYKGASNADLPIGVYFYSVAITEQEAIDEARFTLELLKNRKLAYPVFFDTEESNREPLSQASVGKEQLTKTTKAFCDYILNNSNYKVGVYASKSWFNSKLNYDDIAKYSIWVAQYNTVCTFEQKYDMWQYSSVIKLDGVSGHDSMVDANFLYVDFNTQETEIKETMLLKCIKVSTTKGYPYRNKAGGTVTGYYKVGDTIKVTNAYSFKKVANVGSADAWFIDDKGNHFAFDKDYFA